MSYQFSLKYLADLTDISFAYGRGFFEIHSLFSKLYSQIKIKFSCYSFYISSNQMVFRH